MIKKKLSVDGGNTNHRPLTHPIHRPATSDQAYVTRLVERMAEEETRE